MKPDSPDSPDIESIASDLLRWFSANARDLPWRRTRDPYAIWVSEVMLQQTQVATVIPYWTRWMRALPTIGDLADAPMETVLKLWEGLGYYRRARHLAEAAKIVVNRHRGEIPANAELLRALPGIGRYTAGAISSIAFNRPEPVLDGNIIRVLTRVFGIHGNPNERSVNARLWRLSGDIVQSAADAGLTAPVRFPFAALNQTLMELGALVCTPRNPECGRCPVRIRCRARLEGLIALLPETPARPAAIRKRFLAFVIQDRRRYLVAQRPDAGINGGLWEFPNQEVPMSRTKSERSRKLDPVTILTHLFPGNPPPAPRHLAVIRHAITRYQIVLDAYLVVWSGASKHHKADGQWMTRRQLDRLPFSSAHRKIVGNLEPDVEVESVTPIS